MILTERLLYFCRFDEILKLMLLRKLVKPFQMRTTMTELIHW